MHGGYGYPVSSVLADWPCKSQVCVRVAVSRMALSLCRLLSSGLSDYHGRHFRASLKQEVNMQNAKPRIGVIGTGAIGGFYGLMLARAGHDVHFLLRSEYSAVREHGITVDSRVHGELNLNPVQAYADVAEMPTCDWLLVGAKSTTN